MEIRDPIHGSINLSDAEVAVMESQAFQRLRSIKQLGFSEHSFPGATHNRYLHSVGVCHVAGLLFDSIFKDFQFSTEATQARLRQVVRLAALLHDVGHGPLSHTTEEVMPQLSDLKIKAYENLRTDISIGTRALDTQRQADHEDFTIKFVTDSDLSKIIEENCADIAPIHVACLIDKTLACPDEFFQDGTLGFRSILSQIVSSEMDADRLDYLERDAYFCGTNYGRVELSWLVANATYNIVEGELFLAINRRALYAFDDFLLARHHMHLMVYFHHKSIVYEEMLIRYLASSGCQYKLPHDINEYIRYNDFGLYEHLATVDNFWAQKIALRQPFKMVFEYHSTSPSDRVENIKKSLEDTGIQVILASSSTRLSKYHSSSPIEKSFSIFVVDQYDHLAKPYRVEESTEIFQKYEEIRRIERVYVDPSDFRQAESHIYDHKL